MVQLELDTYDMHHYVYCIENLVNGKIYIGKHSTDSLEDGYMGSGKFVTRAITKHGLENFRKFIIAELETEEKAYEFEKLLVTEEFVSDENTYNLIEGGKGNFAACNDFYKKNPEARKRSLEIANRATWANPLFRKRKSEELTKRNKERHELGISYIPDWNGRHHSHETKTKIGKANAIAQKGEKNSQFGTCWVSHPEQKKSQRVNKGEVEGYLADGWVKGRKMKW